jgi:hypothetical protein
MVAKTLFSVKYLFVDPSESASVFAIVAPPAPNIQPASSSQLYCFTSVPAPGSTSAYWPGDAVGWAVCNASRVAYLPRKSR